jgi:hypothetical protein
MDNPWLALSIKAFELGVDAQHVITLRWLRMASGGTAAQAEFTRMVAEKVAAVAEAQVAVATAALDGTSDHATAGKVLTVFRKRVRANKRRLTRQRKS